MDEIRQPQLSAKDFNHLSEFIYQACGIKMPSEKKVLLQSRLQKRLKSLNFSSFSEYCRYLLSDEGKVKEFPDFINRITTNTTSFFRNPDHFKFLEYSVLPQVVKDLGSKIYPQINIWSAACSSGEEAYTIAMTLSELLGKSSNLTFEFRILATDISNEVLQSAKKAIYSTERTEGIPHWLKRKYFLKSKDKNKGLERVVPELRSLVSFQLLNFMDNDFGFKAKFEIIFCRNVLIYFDKHTQEKILRKIIKYLQNGGFLFLGHSESLHRIDLPLKPVAPTVYQKVF